MKAIALRKNSAAVELIDIPRPIPKADEVLIKTIRCGLCGTDREIIRRGIPDVPPGEEYLILGHECLGQIEAVGAEAETDLKVGDRVLYAKYTGNEIKVDGVEHLLMEESDVLARIKD